eukprot:TRINITY_DN121574_c0_g1_i1.p1 TRINITY_DN121574_c0_g1~~TRINITY_DN121574_c0_g1_i1.p1  ORF type:complete len:420 (+),score=49.10 TRINITY_DN121574_c0_g1_i1:42-1301(+)
MSVVRREGKRARREQKRALPSPAVENERVKRHLCSAASDGSRRLPVQASTTHVVNPSLRPTQTAKPVANASYETLAARHDIPDNATVTFVFVKAGDRRLQVKLEELLKGTSAGWLWGALPDAVNDEVRVPEDTPLTTRSQVSAFQLLLETVCSQPGSRLSDVFCASVSKLRLLPQAYLVAHLLGMERQVNETRGLFLQDPMLVFRSLRIRKGEDGPLLRRAMDLGLARTTAPLRLGVKEQIDAASTLLRLLPADSGSHVLESATSIKEAWSELTRDKPTRLLHVFCAAHNLHCAEVQTMVRTFVASKPAILHELVREPNCVQAGTADSAALRLALRHGLDKDCKLRAVHVAATLGLQAALQIAVEEGQSVNLPTSSTGETPAILAAVSGHKEVLQWLGKKGANLSGVQRIIARRGLIPG